MAPIDLNLLRAFAAVYETESFSKAADALGVPRSTVSRSIAALEAGVGAQLFLRTTRSVTRTPEARALFDRIAAPLSGLEAALSEAPERRETPSGTLRVTTTVDLGAAVLAEAAARFTARYPEVEVEVHLGNEVIDLAREGVDCALRVAMRALKSSSLVARKVGMLRMQLYASPSYVGRRGLPKSPAELAEHEWVGFVGAPSTLSGLGGIRLRPPRIRCDDMRFRREVARHDGGIALLPVFVAAGDVAAGRLVPVLPRLATTSGTVYLVQPARKHPPAKVTAFRALLLELLRQRPLD